jgi:hypothetical protein
MKTTPCCTALVCFSLLATNEWGYVRSLLATNEWGYVRSSTNEWGYVRSSTNEWGYVRSRQSAQRALPNQAWSCWPEGRGRNPTHVQAHNKSCLAKAARCWGRSEFTIVRVFSPCLVKVVNSDHRVDGMGWRVGWDGVEGWMGWGGGLDEMGWRVGWDGVEGWMGWGGGLDGMGWRVGWDGVEGWIGWGRGLDGMAWRVARTFRRNEHDRISRSECEVTSCHLLTLVVELLVQDTVRRRRRRRR